MPFSNFRQGTACFYTVWIGVYRPKHFTARFATQTLLCAARDACALGIAAKHACQQQPPHTGTSVCCHRLNRISRGGDACLPCFAVFVVCNARYVENANATNVTSCQWEHGGGPCFIVALLPDIKRVTANDTASYMRNSHC